MFLTFPSKHSRPMFLKLRQLSSSASPECCTSVVPHMSVDTALRRRADFDSILDVRTPAEFEEDRIPGSVNLPVLTNEQRVTIGTLYSGNSFEARKQGAALISRNIGQHLEEYFKDKSKNHKPLVYCWRGGQRSRSLAIILKEIGFQPTVVRGGYKEYRRMVRSSLFDLSPAATLAQFRLVRVSGATGSGKSQLLEALRARGEQVLHLEQLARHKGSVLGQYPGQQQPNQKMFETLLYQQIETEFTPDKVVWVENESSKIGSVIIPLGLWRRMQASPRVQIDVELEDRVSFILGDYDYMTTEENREHLLTIISSLERYAGRKKSQMWCDLVSDGRYRDLVRDLIVNYYDLNYKKPSMTSAASLNVPSGLILRKDDLLHSSVVDTLVSFGENIILNNVTTGDQNTDSFTASLNC